MDLVKIKKSMIIDIEDFVQRGWCRCCYMIHVYLLPHVVPSTQILFFFLVVSNTQIRLNL